MSTGSESEECSTGMRTRGSTNSDDRTINDEDIQLLLSYQSNHLGDAGNKLNDHYKSRLSPFRYKLRSWLLPVVRSETVLLFKLQSKVRYPLLDIYFAWSANLALHTFYVLMLPMLMWFGGSRIARDLITVLGLGIYFSGFLKDYMCLPRPRSPPVHRITMSSYTTQEYGFPLSHAANATAVVLVLLAKLFEFKELLSTAAFNTICIVIGIYYFSLIFGRLYCGMHGLVDILTGGIVGTLCFCFRHFLGTQWDQILLTDSQILPMWTVICFICIGYLFLIHIHAEPVDDCPCFDDSVAFIGVLIGLDVSHLIAYKTNYLTFKNAFSDPLLIPFDFAHLGIFKVLLRVALGVVTVVIWKAVLKPIVFTILPPIYKYIGVYLPRKNFIPTAFTKKLTRQIRSTSILNDSMNLHNLLYGVSHEMGPHGEIDYYEMLDYKTQQHVNTTDDEKDEEDANEIIMTGGVFKPRYDVEIIGRLIIYAGVTGSAFWGFALGCELFGLT